MGADRIEIVTLGFVITAVLIAEWAAGGLARTYMINPLWIIALTRIFETGIIIYIVRISGVSLRAAGLNREYLRPGLETGLKWSAVFGIIAVLLIAVLKLSGANPVHHLRMQPPAGIYHGLLFFLVGGIISPIAEELLFRGIIYGYFRRWGVIAALAVSSLAFILAHLPNNRLHLTHIVGGIVFALAYERGRHIITPIIIHVLGNSALLGLAYLSGL